MRSIAWGWPVRRAVWAIVAILALAVTAGAAEVRVYTASDGLPSNWVTALAASPDGKLWVGTGNAGVYLLDPATGKGKGYRTADGLSSDEVKSIAVFGERVYVGTSAGLSVYDGSRWDTISAVENVTMRNVVVAASPDGRELWACSVYLAGGAVRFDGREWKFMGGEGRGLFNDVQGFAFLPEAVLMGSGAGVPYLRKEGEVTPLTEGLPPGSIFAAGARDGEWLVGTSRGLYGFRRAWVQVPLPAGLGGAPVFSIASRGNRVALGTAGGLVLLEDGKSRALTEGKGLPAARVTAVALLDGAVAAGTARGLAMVTKW